MKLSPQKEYILSFLRDLQWHCGSDWLNRVKDDRKRLGEMSEYLAGKGFKIASQPCKGKSCGNSTCPLFRRRAVKIEPKESWYSYAQEQLRFFDSYHCQCLICKGCPCPSGLTHHKECSYVA